MKLKCKKCKQMKHDTAFEFKTYKWYEFWKISLELDTTECLDCKYPHRWDEVRQYFKDFL